MKPTMMDVAARASVSQATVSLILNGSSGARFSEATRKKVMDAVQELGYRLPNRSPSGDLSDSRVICFITDELTTDPWMALAFEGAREKALEFGIIVTLGIFRAGEDPEEDVFSLCQQQPLLGYIFGTILTRKIDPPAALFTVPSVLVNCYDQDRRLPSIVPGDVAGGRAATERLIRAGRSRVALINGQEGLDNPRDRLRGYKQALASNDFTFDPQLVRYGNWEPSSGYSETHFLMDLPNPPDAIFCANDLMALGCVEALKERGKSIPKDVSVIGFDNRDIAQFIRPPLTTLHLPLFEMGAMAVEMIHDIAGGLKSSHDQLKVECALVERESV
ncbi:LacI family transcriptional regulator [Neorhizobium galegae]|uniref:LacI family DNA-binding transcriptional regulator n=2 Tax=Neorhizobium galegae TaxID=399 RepID=UPI001EC3B1C9|nr:LacI family DNA-binding transcriptional regulator [Neorhizobium galegae]MBP2557290.1 LacI family transcriptional regulator [Neorhizobium galegae]